MFEQMVHSSGFWAQVGPFSDIIISTRLRLARNQSDIVFPLMQDNNDKEKVRALAQKFAAESVYSDNLIYLEMKDLSELDRRFLRERNVITEAVEESPESAVIYEKNHLFSILINEEDHFRIQVIRSGIQLHDTYRLIDQVR